jgi:hypothetical protein
MFYKLDPFFAKYQNKFDLHELSSNYRAVQYLKNNKKKINIDSVSQNINPDVLDIIENNIAKVDYKQICTNEQCFHIVQRLIKANNGAPPVLWNYISKNPSASKLFKDNINKLDWDFLSANRNAVTILEQNKDKINYTWLSANINAIHLIEENLNEAYWSFLSANINAIHILEKNLDKVDWYSLSSNPNAIHIIEKNLDKVQWETLSSNPNAIHIIEKNLDKVDWRALSSNPNAINIIKENMKRIDFSVLSSNEGIFIYDYELMKEKKAKLHQELMDVIYHPDNYDYVMTNLRD